MGKKLLPGIVSIVLLSAIFLNAFPQTDDYSVIFGNDWQKALLFLSQNEGWIKPVLDKNDISYNLAIGIIFPELIRYSALKDKMEITLLKTLYINLGEDYADFSIGPFQMKPSFAESVRNKAPGSIGRKTKRLQGEDPGQHDIRKYRKFIVDDLEDPSMQLRYLIAFIKICENKFQGNWEDENSKLRFLATAYNCGIKNTPEEITGMMNKKFFNTTLFKSKYYCYQEISAFWYLQNNPQIK